MTAVTWEREASPEASRPSLWERRRRERRDAEHASWLVRRCLAAMANSGLARHTESCGGLPGMVTPQVRSVRLGTVDRLLVQLMTGQTPAELREIAPNLAEAFGVRFVRVRRRSPGYVFLELHRTDPLDQVIALPDAAESATEPVLFGRTDDNRELRISLADQAHVLVQGQTRSGKSRFLYGLLSQVSDTSDVLICGSDITALVLRPFLGSRHGHLIATGAGDIAAHADVLDELVTIMDDRIARIPADQDVYPCGPNDPYLVTLLEELPGLLRRAAQVDGRKNGPLHARIQSAYGRLLAEGAKAGFRLIIVMQRADATIIGGYERAQCPLRISFAVDDRAAVRMLHPAASDELADYHCSAPAGRALVSMPGLPIGRFRSPEMGSYQEYVINVLEASAAESVAVA
jgi:hypothetical protein